jgi:hypothetical protein
MAMTLEQNQILEKIPTRRELMEDVLRLQQVSEVLSELLARRIGPVNDPPKLNELISECIGEQTRIVDKFLALSDDQSKKASLNNLITAIEEQTRLMEGCSDEQERQRLKDDIHGYIDEWIEALEKILAGVVESLPDEEEIPPAPVADEESKGEEGAEETSEGKSPPAPRRISYREQGYAEEPGFAEEPLDAHEIVITEQDGHFEGKA